MAEDMISNVKNDKQCKKVIRIITNWETFIIYQKQRDKHVFFYIFGRNGITRNVTFVLPVESSVLLVRIYSKDTLAKYKMITQNVIHNDIVSDIKN